MPKELFTSKTKKEIVMSYTLDEIHTIAELARKYGCATGTIRKTLIEKGVVLRTRAESQTRPGAIDSRDIKRFWAKVDKRSVAECWPWKATTDTCGYGRFGFRKKLLSAHRFSWTLEYGNIPYSKHVLHMCDNPKCCNPHHLFLGTHQENMADRGKKGRSRGGSNKGESSANSRYKTSDIIEIRSMFEAGYKQKEIAKKFSTTQPVISNIINRKTWKHI